MKRLTVWLITGLLVLGLLPSAALAESNVEAGGKAVGFDVQPAVVNGVFMVPIRAVAESLGGTVAWQQETQTASFVVGSDRVELTVGSAVGKINARSVALSAPVIITDGRTLVPASFVLTFFGSKIKINDPAVKDPAAMALLEKSGKNTAADFDMALDLRMTMSLEDFAGMAIPPSMQNLGFAAKGQAQVRGKDMLLTETIKASEPSDTLTTLIAVRGDTAYISSNDEWHATTVDVATAQGAQMLLGREQLVGALYEAHLGALRTVNGKTLRDVVVTFDPSVMKGLTDPVLMSTLGDDSAVTTDVVWETLSATLTLDSVTGEHRGTAVDMAAAISSTAGGLTMKIHTVVHETVTITPSTAPISWPKDMP